MPTKHVVGFSGGVDSQACALWVRQRHPAADVILLNTDAGGNEHRITAEFIRRYSETVFPVTVVPSLVKDLRGKEAAAVRRLGLSQDDPLTFDLLGVLKGRFPSSQRQWCTTFLKLYPQQRWCEAALTANGLDYARYSGVRRDESRGRKDTAEVGWDDLFDCELHAPLAGWSKAEAFAFVAAHGEETNPLYRMGFSRVGCSPCINANKDDVRLWAARSPESIDKVREWEKKVGWTFFPPMVPGKTLNWVDEVVEWSKTARGGRQYDLPVVEMEAAAGTCSSKYGLCE